MKIFIGIFVALTLAVVGFYLFFGGAEIKNYPSVNSGPIVAFGDSLVEGVGSSGGGFVSILSEKIGEPIINLGHSGDTTRDGLSRLQEVLDQKPSITILLLGGNDYLRKIPPEETFRNLETLVSKLQEAGSIVVLLGVRGGLFIDHFDEDFEDLAERTETVYVPNILAGLLNDKKLMSDTIHPNDAGYTLIAEKIYPELKKVLQ